MLGMEINADTKLRNALIKNPQDHKAALEIAIAALQNKNLAEAIHFMQLAAEIAPAVAIYRRNLGELLRRAGQYDKAIATHNVAISLEPYSAESYYLLGLVYNDKCQFELAIHHYHIALQINQKHGLTWNNLGATLESIGDKKTAKVAYATAIALNPQHAEAQNNLAAIYSEEGRLDEACKHFAEAITANADFVDAHYNLSLIKTYTADDPHLNYLESMISKINHYSVPMQIRYYFALGKALDDVQQYKKAFKAYAEGNRLHYLYKPWDKSKLQELVAQMPSIFSQSFLKPAQITKNKRCPIFIVGMPRSGTTLIEQILSTHESIYGAGELHYLDEIIQGACQTSGMPFNEWVRQLDDSDFANLGKKYLDRTWDLAPEKNFIIDKMPGNCFYVGMIYRMFPKVKIIHAMRDPMDSCFSCFTHLFKDNMAFAYDLAALGIYYTLYAKAMQHWDALLPKNTIFDLPYEQMIKNHDVVSKQLVDYIGLDWDPNCLNFYNNKRTVKTASLTQVRKPIYKTSVQRWRHFENDLETLLNIVGPYRSKVMHDNN